MKLSTNVFVVWVNISASGLGMAGVQKTSEAEVSNILKQMAGCFEVSFNYVEDGDHDAFYQPVLEESVVSSENPLVLSRTLIVDGLEQKHWSDEWTQIEGRRWQQKVVGPFGDFRYVCEGTWVMNQWSCEALRSPKPRRDQSRPYTYLDRVNTLQVNAKRWVHSQTNRKLKDDGELYSLELGWNLYQRVDDSRCQRLSRSNH